MTGNTKAEQLRAAIVGCGSIAPMHSAALAQSAHGRLVAVADVEESRAMAFAAANECEYMVDYHDLLEDGNIDVIHVCTPHHLHVPIAKDALTSGKHVLIEKPVALTMDDARELQDLSQRVGKQVGVVYQNRYNESSVKMKEWAESGRYGRVLGMRAFVTWSRGADYYNSGAWRGKWATEGGGLLINQAIHTLDLLQWLGGDMASIKGQWATHVLQDVIEVEDTAHAIIDFNSGARAVFFGTNAYVANSPIDIEVICEHATFTQRNEALYLVKDGAETIECEPPVHQNFGKSYWGVGHERLIADFYQHLIDNRPFPIDALEASKSLRIVRSIHGRDV